MKRYKIIILLLSVMLIFSLTGNIFGEEESHKPVIIIPVILDPAEPESKPEKTEPASEDAEETGAGAAAAETDEPDDAPDHSDLNDNYVAHAENEEENTDLPAEMNSLEDDRNDTFSDDSGIQDPDIDTEIDSGNADIDSAGAESGELTEIRLSDIDASEASETEEDPDPVDPEKLLTTADEIYFTHKGYVQDFSEVQGYVNEVIDPNVIHQYYVRFGKGTDILMSMLPSEKTVRTGNKRINITQVWEDEFHVRYSLQRTENLPSGRGGGCWIKYSSELFKASGSESGIILYPGERAYYFSPVNGVMTYEPIADLTGLNQDEVIDFEFIRLDGITYFYADGQFLFSFRDNIVGNVSFAGGSILYANGNRVRCEFDNFSMAF